MNLPTLIEAQETKQVRRPEGLVPLGDSPTQGMTDAQRESAICRASELMELLHAEYRCYDALWRRNGCFNDKSAYDLALSNCHKAREIMESLIKGRSQEMVAFLERQRGLSL